MGETVITTQLVSSSLAPNEIYGKKHTRGFISKAIQKGLQKVHDILETRIVRGGRVVECARLEIGCSYKQGNRSKH